MSETFRLLVFKANSCLMWTGIGDNRREVRVEYSQYVLYGGVEANKSISTSRAHTQHF